MAIVRSARKKQPVTASSKAVAAKTSLPNKQPKLSSTITHYAPKPSPASSLNTADTINATTMNTADADVPDDMAPPFARIASSSRTPHEKRVWTALCQVPRGRVTTYALLSVHLGSSPRAVGGALRRNPFAPGVPCHRVVATGGGLGGFKGQWRPHGEGITLAEKTALLRREGVRLDGKGRVLGTPWDGFV